MFGFIPVTTTRAQDVQDERIGKNSEVFAIGDAVAEASGLALVASNSSRILGFANQAVTMASNNATVALATIEYTPMYVGDVFEADFDGNVTQATAVGFYTILTGTTGAQQLASASLSATVGQFRITQIDPRGTGSLTRVLGVVAFSGYVAATAS